VGVDAQSFLVLSTSASVEIIQNVVAVAGSLDSCSCTRETVRYVFFFVCWGGLRLCVSDVINFRLETVIITSLNVCVSAVWC